MKFSIFALLMLSSHAFRLICRAEKKKKGRKKKKRQNGNNSRISGYIHQVRVTVSRDDNFTLGGQWTRCHHLARPKTPEQNVFEHFVG